MADPAGLTSPRSLWRATVALLAVAAALVVTTAHPTPQPIERETLLMGLSTCENAAAPVPLLCAALSARGWTITRLGDDLAFFPPSP